MAAYGGHALGDQAYKIMHANWLDGKRRENARLRLRNKKRLTFATQQLKETKAQGERDEREFREIKGDLDRGREENKKEWEELLAAKRNDGDTEGAWMRDIIKNTKRDIDRFLETKRQFILTARKREAEVLSEFEMAELSARTLTKQLKPANLQHHS